jgi:hypothetical protein
MKEFKSIFALLVLMVGGFVLYKVVPAYWGDYKLGRLLEEQAQVNTYNTKSDQDVKNVIAQKAHEIDVPISPEQVTVVRSASELSITAVYSVQVDLPLYPLELNFTTGTRNKNVMK